MIKSLVEALNEINTNVWAFALIILGSILVIRHVDTVGEGIIGGGLSMLNASARQTASTEKGNIQVNATK